VSLAENLQDLGIAALTIHGRTRAQLYSGVADWSLIRQVKGNPRMVIPIIGNGDIKDVPSAIYARDHIGTDGIMIGRAAIGNPWIFKDISHYMETGETLPEPTLENRIDTCVRHVSESVKWKGEMSGMLEMRRHYSHYFKGLPDFKPFRMKLMTLVQFDDFLQVMNEIRNQYL
jgi:tRNA-dihydrouridine synthase